MKGLAGAELMQMIRFILVLKYDPTRRRLL
jgi:hypothetical protein